MKSIESFCLLVCLIVMIERTLSYKSGCDGGYCFILPENAVGESYTQSDAQQWCANNGTKLIEIQNNYIQNALTNFINGPSTKPSSNVIFTNGVRRSITWSRLSGNGIGSISVKDETDATYDYGYLKLATSGFDVYASRQADNKLGYICSGSQLDCTNGGGVSINGQCYKSYNGTLSWYDARNRCLDGGCDLASFDNITTNAGFNALNGSWLNPSTTYWIGFRRELWIWQRSNVEVRYSQWSSYHPDNQYRDPYNCLCLLPYYPYQWTECLCYDHSQFLCISGSPNTTTSTTTTSTTTRSTMTTTPAVTRTSSSSFDSPAITSSSSNPIDDHLLAASSTTNTPDTAVLAAGARKIVLGVGLGVGLPLLLSNILLAVIVFQLRRRLRKEKQTPPKPTVDCFILETNHDDVTDERVHQEGQSRSTEEQSYEQIQKVSDPPTPYDELQPIPIYEDQLIPYDLPPYEPRNLTPYEQLQLQLTAVHNRGTYQELQNQQCTSGAISSFA